MVLCFKDLFTGQEIFTIYFLMVQMTVLKQAGGHRDVLCRMMLLPDPQIIYQPGHLRALGFSAAALSHLHRRQPVTPELPTPQSSGAVGQALLFAGVEAQRSCCSLLLQGSVPWLLHSQSSQWMETGQDIAPTLCTMPNQPAWLREWEKTDCFGGFLSSLVEEESFKAMIAPGKQNLPGDKAFQR